MKKPSNITLQDPHPKSNIIINSEIHYHSDSPVAEK